MGLQALQQVLKLPKPVHAILQAQKIEYAVAIRNVQSTDLTGRGANVDC